jgi:two-component system chemotaxis sensor kinase CheA
MDELLDQFLIEGRELVQLASDDLMALEQDPINAARLDSVFRAVHTLKGSAALFDFAPMGEALHEAENVLGAVRDGRLPADRAVIGALLDCVGVTERWLADIAQTGQLPVDAPAQGRRLEQALRAPLPQESGGPAGPSSEPIADWLQVVLERHAFAVAAAQVSGRTVTAVRYVPNADCFFLGNDPLTLVRSIPDLIGLHIEPRLPWATHALDPFSCNLIFELLSTAQVTDIVAAFRLVRDQVAIAEVTAETGEDTATPERMTGETAASRVLRIDAARVDALVDIVGELIVTKNSLAHLAGRAGEFDQALGRAIGTNQVELDRLIGTLHRAIMNVRMTPLSQTFRRLPRLVRETAERLGKQVALEISGEEVEADKTIVDGLFEPLLHVLRNAVDHGTEGPSARLAQGKPAAGRIILAGRREGDRIVITIADDGPGINLEQVRRAAIAGNLLTEGALAALDDAAVAALVFTPGLSTAGAVTNVSGRGVGMDSVRTGVEALGGRVVLTSVAAVGSTVRLTLPQAVLVTTVMTVRIGLELYGVPIEVVAETTRVPAERIRSIRSGEAFVLRDRTIPLLQLSGLLGLAAMPRPPSGIRVLIIHHGEQRVGVEVDGFAERLDVLLRPMTGLLSGMVGVLGTALLGDGRVLMVLDLPELIG